MEIKGNISISGRWMTVSPIISESFVCETSDLSSHAVSVNMTDSGIVTLKIDGQGDSSYRKEIMESQPINIYVERLHRKLAGAYDSLSDFYLKMHTKAEKTYKEIDVDSFIKELKCDQYPEKPFEIEKPLISNVESDLREDAESEDIFDESEIDKYVASHIDDCYKYRIQKWENLKQYHAYVQSFLSKFENDRLKRQYDIKRRSLQAILDGDPSYVNKKLRGLESTLHLPSLVSTKNI